MSQLGREPGADARDDPHRDIHGDDGGSAIAEEGKGDTDYRQNIEAHADVEPHLGNEHSAIAHTDQRGEGITGHRSHIKTADNDGRQQQNYQSAADESQLLSTGGEDKVIVALRQGGAVLGLDQRAVQKALAGEAAERMAR